MIDITQDIHSLTEFKKNTNHFLIGLQKTKRPSILTVNGKAKLVIMDASVYQQIQNQIESANDFQIIKNSLEDFENGEFFESKKVLADLKQKVIGKSKKSVKSKK